MDAKFWLFINGIFAVASLYGAVTDFFIKNWVFFAINIIVFAINVYAFIQNFRIVRSERRSTDRYNYNSNLIDDDGQNSY